MLQPKKPRRLKNGMTNLAGTRIGYLLVLQRMKSKVNRWKVKCTAIGCGKELIVAHYCLIRKEPKTHCGCVRKGLPTLHPKEYHSWWDAKNRCHNEDHPSYPSYGAKGIQMCQEWQESFATFLRDMGVAPKDFTLDRINPHGNYEPANTRWADDITQARNKKSSKYVNHPKTGERVLAAALAEELKVPYQKLRSDMMKKGTWE